MESEKTNIMVYTLFNKYMIVLTNQYTILGLQSTQFLEILQTPVMHGHGMSGVEQVNQLVLLF